MKTYQQQLENSKSPIRPKKGLTWNELNKVGMNKSAIVEPSYNPQPNLPTKLQQMKTMVQRERSVNAENERDNSLYGRKKATEQIESEFQKLRESYNSHRKPLNRSQSGIRSSIGALQKQNFVEDPFDDANENNKMVSKSLQNIG